MKTRIGLALVASVLFIAYPAIALEPPSAPQVLFEDLYADVELERIFPDSKEFADATPTSPPGDILALYHAQKPFSPEALKRFVAGHFDLPADPPAPPTTAAPGPIRQHIDALWDRLTRDTETSPPYSSLLPLPRPYVVPGGRFRELYTGTRISPCWALPKAAGAICSRTWSRTSSISSTPTDMRRTARVPTI